MQSKDVELSTTEEMFSALCDAVIETGEINEEGLHLYLKDGRVLVFVSEGMWFLGLARIDDKGLQ